MKNRMVNSSSSIIKTIANHAILYPTPANLSYAWSFGSLVGLYFAIQIVTGIILAMHYVSDASLALGATEVTAMLIPFFFTAQDKNLTSKQIIDDTKYPSFKPRENISFSFLERIVFYFLKLPFLLLFYYSYFELQIIFIPINLIFLFFAILLQYQDTYSFFKFFLLKLNFIWINKQYIFQKWTFFEKFKFCNCIKNILIFHFIFANKFYQPIFFALHSIVWIETFNSNFTASTTCYILLGFTYFLLSLAWTSTFSLLWLLKSKRNKEFTKKFYFIITKNLAYAILGNPVSQVQVQLIQKAGAAAVSCAIYFVGLHMNLEATNRAFEIHSKAESERYRVHLEKKEHPKNWEPRDFVNPHKKK